MAFDGLFTKAIVVELQKTINGGRISRIHQPFDNELIITLRAQGKNHRLLLSAHPQYARVQLTEGRPENPHQPPQFCMVLRKHLNNAIIEDIRQAGLDRVIIINLKGRDELGDLSIKKLIIEVMGRHSNIILVDKETNTIIDSIKHISEAMSRYRTVFPGQQYISPPPQEKQNPFTATDKDILKYLDFNSGRIDRQLVQNFAGLSPLAAREIVFNAKLANRRTIPTSFLNFVNTVSKKEFQPTISSSEKQTAFYFIPLNHLNESYQSFPTLSEMLDRYYFKRADFERVKQRAQNIVRVITNERDKNVRKIERLETTYQKAQKGEQYKLFGELLTAHIYMMKTGMEEIEVPNYYDENNLVTIKLNPMKTPAENAQYYYSKYNKAKTALVVVKEQIKLANLEINYLENLLQQIEIAAPEDIAEIQEELIAEGYLRKRRGSKKGQNRKAKPKLEKYYSTDGTLILVGKNNTQNDYLTMRLARQDEIWLHTKDIPGSHVVIRSTTPSEKTILEAAHLAAYYSKARQSSSVPVDFTKIRHVRKPRGAKPGYVIYDQQQTVFVTPKEDYVIKLRKNNE